MQRKFLFVSAFILSLGASFAQAQVSGSDAARVERLERDIMLLQKQLAKSGVRVETSTAAAGADVAGSGPELDLRISAMEESMRELRGKVEENDFTARRVAEEFEKFKKDTEFRFEELSKNSAGHAAAEPAAAPAEEASAEAPERKPIGAAPAEGATEEPSGATTAGDGTLRAPDPNALNTDSFETPRDLYNYAFRLLNQTRYEAAADAFASFAQKYPKDPLIGNAYYWQGETFYIRRDYVNAADAFRQGFEALPSGPKAPDNLLKLAMSLDALDRNKEACVVLKQITTKYKKSSINIADKAGREQKRIGCK